MSDLGEQHPHRARDHAEHTARELFDQVRDLVADRFAEARLERDPHGELTALSVTVIDLSERDLHLIEVTASELGVLDWLRVVPAEPADLATRMDLRRDLGLLQRPHTDVLQQYPTLDTTYQRPPVRIYLNPTGASVAADLHARYGSFVRLRVGALPYPPMPRTPDRRLFGEPGLDVEAIDPERARIVLDGPLNIASGHTQTHAVLLTNLGSAVITVATNGQLTALTVDASGAVVGGFTGAQPLPLIEFTAQPGQTVRIPLLVGTASSRPELGYTVPPGPWHLVAPLHLSDDTPAITPQLPFTVTE